MNDWEAFYSHVTDITSTTYKTSRYQASGNSKGFIGIQVNERECRGDSESGGREGGP